MKKLKSLSIVIPCFNEEDTLLESYKELKPILTFLNKSHVSEHQIVMVNNGSVDRTLEKMLSLKQMDSNIKIVDLRNNFGYQSSISAGLFNADNDLIISIDADLQDDPSKIKEMIELHYQGFDMVLGIREDRSTDNFFKRFFAEFFYKISNLLGVGTEFNHGDFRLMTKDLVNEIEKYPEKNRYLRGMILLIENKYAKVFYSRRKRQHGYTKFKPFNLISLALEGITSFSVQPIRLIFLLGLLMFLISIVSGVYIIYLHFFEKIVVKGWSSTFVLILFLGGVQNIFIGIIGEYISKTYIETKNRPLYLIRKIY